MKRWWLGVLMAAMAVASMPDDAFAKRLGGGRPAGLQRQMPAPNKPVQADPSRPNAPGVPAQGAQQQVPGMGTAGAAANAGKRSWLGPLAGLAAGLGLAALASHFGFGEGLANLMMILLLGAAAFIGLRWVLSRMGGATRPAPSGLKPGYASAGGPAAEPLPTQAPLQRSDFSTAANGHSGGFVSAAQSFSQDTGMSAVRLPTGFDQAGFERAAKMIFIRMQAANDAGNLDDLRQFTTPEMFAALRLDLQERGQQPQQTDVEELHAQILHADEESERLIVSVRFHGRIREEIGQPSADPFDEIWHLVRQNGQEVWRIAGIQPTQVH